MPPTLELQNRKITYNQAIEDETNVIQQLKAVKERAQFYHYLSQHESDIRCLVSHHLGFDTSERCVVSPMQRWMSGRFNVCIPVRDQLTGRVVILRCPMPHTLAETSYPGNIEEKIRCEVATYAWMQDKHPDIPIAHLFGFGFGDGQHFTHSKNLPFYARLTQKFRRFLCRLMKWPIPSHYLATHIQAFSNTAYIVLEYIDPKNGMMLSNTWAHLRSDRQRTENLFRGLAKIIISLRRVPLPRIGSLRFRNNGTVSLANRPLSCSLVIIENGGAKRVIERDQTYSSIEPYISDLLTCHDERFLSQPNAIVDERDGQSQLTTMTVLRALSHHYFDRSLREGPFILWPTDLHPSNILVDEYWNVKYLIDLEWFCSLPIQMCDQPYWLTGKGIDELDDEELDRYNNMRRGFLRILREEEAKDRIGLVHTPLLSEIMEAGWEMGRYWYVHSLMSINAMYNLFYQHVRPRYINLDLARRMDKTVFSRFWLPNSENVLSMKIADKERYDKELLTMFMAEEEDTKVTRQS